MITTTKIAKHKTVAVADCFIDGISNMYTDAEHNVLNSDEVSEKYKGSDTSSNCDIN